MRFILITMAFYFASNAALGCSFCKVGGAGGAQKRDLPQQAPVKSGGFALGARAQTVSALSSNYLDSIGSQTALAPEPNRKIRVVEDSYQGN